MSQYKKKKSCIATEGLGSWAGRWAWQQARAGGAGRSRRAQGAWAQQAGVQGALQAGRQACVGARASAAGAQAVGAGRPGGTGVRAVGACGAGGSGTQGSRHGRGRRAAWALGARPGRVGWPWAVHSVHSAYFRSFLTRFFFLSH